jgi:hypothetical protein
MQDGRPAQVLSLSYPREGRQHGPGLRELVETYGVVGDVLVQIGEQQQELEHAVALLGLWIAGFFLEIFHDRQRVREQPFDIGGVHGPPFAASAEGLVGAAKRVVEKMIEAELFVCQSAGN